jgi:aldose sugar dehydrogenase
MKVRLSGRPGMLMLLTAPVLSACLSGPLPAQGTRQSEHHEFRITTLVEGLEHPWGLAFLPDGGMLVTERPGRLRLIRDGQLQPEPIAGVPTVHARGQGGLLDVALHPDFATNRLVYLAYSKPGADNTATTAVVRGRLDGNALTGVQEIFEADAYRSRGQHYGSRIVFDGRGYMYVTVGDRGDNPHGDNHDAQNLSNHAGKTLRLHDDGRVPADNPFVNRAGAKPEIYTWGNRNQQALALHPQTGQLWSTEHGARGGDELNLLLPGRNYGWPIITHGVNYSGQAIGVGRERQGLEQPIVFWVPSIATSGMAFYTGDRFPQWRNDLFVGGLAGQQLVRIRLRGTQAVEQETVLEGIGRIRDVRSGPDGLIYLVMDAPSAPILRLDPAR